MCPVVFLKELKCTGNENNLLSVLWLFDALKMNHSLTALDIAGEETDLN